MSMKLRVRAAPSSWHRDASILMVCAIAGLAAVCGPARAIDVSVREFTSALFAARDGQLIDYANRDFSGLDLSNTDFKGARLAGANLFGVDLSQSNLSGVDLSGAMLDRATILRSNFAGANLSDARMLKPAAFLTEAGAAADAPRFTGANLARLRASGIFWRADFRGADLTEADFSPFPASADRYLSHSSRPSFRSCDFSGSKLDRANLRHGTYQFSRFVGASLAGADLRYADFSMSDLTDADLTGARIDGASFDGAILAGTRGLR